MATTATSKNEINMSYIVAEQRFLKTLKTPAKIQEYLNSIKFNFGKNGATCYSPSLVMQKKVAHCMEGALFAAAALENLGYKPLVLDLRAHARDFDHVVAVFKKNGYWGAISKTNHAVLRFREPVYKTIRELAMSYFHEYFDTQGRKNLREYSVVLDLNHFNKLNWRTSRKDLFEIPAYLDDIKHYKILNKQQIRNLRKADKIEILAGEIVEYKK